ncbi:hypothetical protein [Parapedobacter indicus]|uniref:Uncharacterized protein n=2 Tax=Parapedobacter indicus TaxID=1477437 RepID=A0A1I3CIW5_9SPHI|nr:hypothetical protein [Parapedobacter indicus]PPL04267.1 hypothetical protein CLV26_10168 [Parapedobacter indicus]SFH74442.1 hypothetical protein SAMN05444682_10155 [Parapedobacter indicus]
MPSNLLKVYNQLLELLYISHRDNVQSIRKVFDRDFAVFPFRFRQYPIHPTPADNEDTMDRVFRHLTTVVVDQAVKKREFETARSIRIHWVKHHLEERKQDVIRVFTVLNENRVYVLDVTERYVVVLEPLRKLQAFFLLTAYHLEDSRYRNLMNKCEKRGKEGVVIW